MKKMAGVALVAVLAVTTAPAARETHLQQWRLVSS
jgi:hypothetical protein